MSLEWKTYTVGELVNKKMLDKPLDGNHGGIHPKSSDYVNEGVPFIMANDLKDGLIDYENCKYISKEQAKTLKKGFSKPGDVLLTHKATIGRTAIVDDSYDTVILTPQVTYYRVLDGINNYYLYFYFNSVYFQNILENWSSSGSTRSYIGISNQLKLPIILPPLEIQNNIVTILFNIDKKIEINKKINKNLEQLMKCIFDDWFVDFNYSDDISFKPSELGEIPSNWNVKKLGDVLITLESGKRPKGGISDIDDGIPSIGAENILGLGKFNYSKNKLISHEFFNTLKKGIIQDKDVLLYKDGAQLGRKSLFMNGFPFDTCCINEHVFRLQCNDEINQFYLYLWLDQEIMTHEIINLNSNSAQPGINQNDVKSLPILVPDSKIMGKFNNIVSPMMNQIFDNALEINKLSNLRDTLLPKLMSGEIDVSKINCDL